jgi:hypothetical protein
MMMNKAQFKKRARDRAENATSPFCYNYDALAESLNPDNWIRAIRNGNRFNRRKATRKLRSWAKTSDGKKAFQGEYKSMARYLK